MDTTSRKWARRIVAGLLTVAAASAVVGLTIVAYLAYILSSGY